MAGHIEKKEVIYILIIVSFLFGVVYFYKGQYFFNDFFRAAGQSRTTGMVVDRSQENQKFQRAIEASLNELLNDVFLDMQEYRKRRKILDELMQAQNFRDAQYITGTYEIGLRTISDLRTRSNSIIGIFSNKDAELKTMIQGRSESARRNIMQAWSRVKAEQVDLYVNYFNIEQTILDKHEQLLTLYFRHRDDVVYYSEAKRFAMKTDALNAQANQYKQEIKQLKQRQATLTQ